MTLSVSKSKIMSECPATWEVFDGEEVVACMDKVIQFRYLGMESKMSPYQGSLAVQRRAILTANKYRAVVLRVARDGPDRVELGLATWESIAKPSFLWGTEFVPLSIATVDELDRCQARVYKELLEFRRCAPNITGEVLLGVKSVRQVLYTGVMKYLVRLKGQPESRWSKDALKAHLLQRWDSPYLAYIARIRTEVSAVVTPVSARHVDIIMTGHFDYELNKSISGLKLPAVQEVDKREMGKHVCEREASRVLSLWKLDQGDLGRRQPREGWVRQSTCPPCRRIKDELHGLSSCHVLMECEVLGHLREVLGVKAFADQYIAQSRMLEEAFSDYVNGLDVCGNYVGFDGHMERGEVIEQMQDEWLALW